MFTFQQIYRYFLSNMNHISLLATDKIKEKFQVSRYYLINTLTLKDFISRKDIETNVDHLQKYVLYFSD